MVSITVKLPEINKTRLALRRHKVVCLGDLRSFCIGTVHCLSSGVQSASLAIARAVLPESALTLQIKPTR